MGFAFHRENINYSFAETRRGSDVSAGRGAGEKEGIRNRLINAGDSTTKKSLNAAKGKKVVQT